jgi:hypothetical protein
MSLQTGRSRTRDVLTGRIRALRDNRRAVPPESEILPRASYRTLTGRMEDLSRDREIQKDI